MTEKSTVTYLFEFKELNKTWRVRDTERNCVVTIAFLLAMIGKDYFKFRLIDNDNTKMAIDCRLLLDHLFNVEGL